MRVLSEISNSVEVEAAAIEFETPLGPVHGVATDRAVVNFGFVDSRTDGRVPNATHGPAVAMLATLRQEVEAYFRGQLREFSVPCDAPGTEFHRRVWDELRRIPFGATISYAELARRIGNPSATRAVGGANARNPIAILVPCHRVIGASGSMTGFAAGIERKRRLLEIEGASGLFNAL